MSQPELAELKEQVYKDPRPAEHFDRFHARTRTRKPDFVYEVEIGRASCRERV